MAEFFRRHSIGITAIALLILSSQLMSLSLQNPRFPRFGAEILGGLFSPIQKGFFEVTQISHHFFSRYVWLQNVVSERDELVKRVKALEAENSRIAEFKNENERLRSLLEYSQLGGFSGVVASVISRDASNWVSTITINRGRAMGVMPGQAVVDGHAILGQIISATENSAKVLLLTDNTSAIDALVQSSRAPGVVEGRLDHTLNLRYVLKEHTVGTGDRVIASGLDGIFPKGGLIGVVTAVHPAESGLFQIVEVEPSVDIRRLEEVMVLTDLSNATGPTVAASEQ